MALRTGLLDAEETLRHPHRARAITRGADFRLGARLRAGTVTDLARHPARHADLRVVAVRGLLECDFHAVAQIGAAVHLRTGTPAAARGATGRLAEDVAENIAEGIRKTAEALLPGSAHVRIDARMAVLVVRRTLLRVRQHFIGFLHLLEMPFRILVARIAVGVVLHRELAISLLDFVIACVLCDAQNLVVIPFRHFGSTPAAQSGAAAPYECWSLPTRPAAGLSITTDKRRALHKTNVPGEPKELARRDNRSCSQPGRRPFCSRAAHRFDAQPSG